MISVASKNHDILKTIIKDLKIKRLGDESRTQYFSRVIYSALSMWIRFSTLDRDILGQASDKVGISKIHILNRYKVFLDNMLELYPEIQEWFYPPHEEDNENPGAIIRNRLYGGGELVDVGFNTDLALPVYQESRINKKVAVVRGLNGGEFHTAAGLAQVKSMEQKQDVNIEEIFAFYGLENKTAKECLKEYLRSIKWDKKEGISYELFNKYSTSPFSGCYDSEYKIKEDEITLYRTNIFDFGFVKKFNGCIYTSSISSYLVDQFEVRRFMYGLKSEAGNAPSAQYKKFEEERLVELNLFNDLPLKEQSVLLLLSWPKKHINDRFNLIFHRSVWTFVEAVLKNLNITLQEVE